MLVERAGLPGGNRQLVIIKQIINVMKLIGNCKNPCTIQDEGQTENDYWVCIQH